MHMPLVPFVSMIQYQCLCLLLKTNKKLYLAILAIAFALALAHGQVTWSHSTSIQLACIGSPITGSVAVAIAKTLYCTLRFALWLVNMQTQRTLVLE